MAQFIWISFTISFCVAVNGGTESSQISSKIYLMGLDWNNMI